jgi:hypothetical protein
LQILQWLERAEADVLDLVHERRHRRIAGAE